MALMYFVGHDGFVQAEEEGGLFEELGVRRSGHKSLSTDCADYTDYDGPKCEADWEGEEQAADGGERVGVRVVVGHKVIHMGFI
jgi:hypothetical protein